MRLAQRNAAKRGNNDGASGRQNSRRQKSANVVKIHIDVEIGFFAVLPFVNAHSTRQFCSSSVQRNKHRRRYVVAHFRRYTGYRGADIVAVFPLFLKDSAIDWYDTLSTDIKSDLEQLLENFKSYFGATVFSQMKLCSHVNNVPMRRPAITLRRCRSWQNEFHICKTAVGHYAMFTSLDQSQHHRAKR